MCSTKLPPPFDVDNKHASADYVEAVRAQGNNRLLDDLKTTLCLSIPDAVLTLKVNGKEMRAALEVELTRKSRQRIFDKLEKFVTTSDYKIALYVVRGVPLIEFLKRTYQEVLEKSWRVKIARVKNAIYFADLDEVLRSGMEAKFVGPTNGFSFAEIS